MSNLFKALLDVQNNPVRNVLATTLVEVNPMPKKKNHVGIVGQIEACMARACAKYGTTWDSIYNDFNKARLADIEAKRLDSKHKFSASNTLANAPRWIFRAAIKDFFTLRAIAQSKGKVGTPAHAWKRLEELRCEAEALAIAMKDSGSLSQLWYRFDVPMWTHFDKVGERLDGSPMFSETDLMTAQELRDFALSETFNKMLVGLVIGHQLKNEKAPKLNLPESDLSNELMSRLSKVLEKKAERDEKQGKLTWDFMAFFEGGLLHNLKDEWHPQTVLAMIGRLITQYNRLMSSVNYPIGKQFMQKGGENGAVVDVLDLYSITLNLEARNSDFGEWVIVDDKELRRLDGDAEQLLEAIEEYIYAWQDNILFPSALEMAGLEYHGGWMFDKEVDKFYTLPFELEQFTMVPDLEAVAKRAEEIRAWVTQRNTGRVTEAISNPMTPAGLLAAQRAKQKA